MREQTNRESTAQSDLTRLTMPDPQEFLSASDDLALTTITEHAYHSRFNVTQRSMTLRSLLSVAALMLPSGCTPETTTPPANDNSAADHSQSESDDLTVDSPKKNIALTSPAYSQHAAPGVFSLPIRAVDGDKESAWNAGRKATLNAPVDLRIVLGPKSEVEKVEAIVVRDEGDLGRGSYVCKLFNAHGTLIDASHISREGIADGELLQFTFSVPIVGNVSEVVLTTQLNGKSWASFREVEIYGAKPIEKSTMKDFGVYFGIWSGKDYTENLKSSSVIQIEVAEEALSTTLKKLKANNQKALIYLWHYFKASPVEDTRWKKALPHLKGYEDTILAFDTFDEPYHKGISREHLESIADIVKKDFPNIPLAINFSYASVGKANFAIPKKHDWVSVDKYFYHQAHTFKDFLDVYGKLKAKMSPHHKLFITADGSVGLHTPGTLKEKQYAAMVRLREYYNWGIHNDNAVLFLPFAWQDGHDCIGATNLPLLRRDLDNIATEITGRY